jgi:hypothetical protein
MVSIHKSLEAVKAACKSISEAGAKKASAALQAQARRGREIVDLPIAFCMFRW